MAERRGIWKSICYQSEQLTDLGYETESVDKLVIRVFFFDTNAVNSDMDPAGKSARLGLPRMLPPTLVWLGALSSERSREVPQPYLPLLGFITAYLTVHPAALFHFQ